MGQPCKQATAGAYYLRREIPAKFRPAFDGKPMWKVSLRTKDFARAAVLFANANAEFEKLFEDARRRLASNGDPRPSQRDRAAELVDAYLQGSASREGGLDGPERLLLCRLETDRGLWDSMPGGCSGVGSSKPKEWWQLSTNAALFRSHRGTLKHLTGLGPGEVWRYRDDRFRSSARSVQIDRVVHQIARYHDLPLASLPEGIGEVAGDYLERHPIGPVSKRKPQTAQSRLRPKMRLTDLFAAWKAKTLPTPQTAHEYERSARDFIGDIPVADIRNDDLLNYRDAAQKLPQSMPRRDRVT